MDALRKQVWSLLEQWPHDGWLIALSGGVDSVVLTHLLCTYPDRPKKVCLAHVDHKMRDDSWWDAMFCTHLAHQLGLPIDVICVDVTKKNSAQSAARAKRYGALQQCAMARGITTIVTAHHEDDVLESSLIKWQRGTTASALSASMNTRTPLQQDALIHLLRPLLHVPRRQIEAYALAHHLDWVEDPSNKTDDYTRNALRHHVMPHWMAQTTQRAGARRTLSNLQDDADALEQWAQMLFESHCQRGSHYMMWRIDLQGLQTAPRSVLVRVLHKINHHLPTPTQWNPRALTRILTLMHSTGTTDVMGARLVSDGEVMSIEVLQNRKPVTNKQTGFLEFDPTKMQTLRWFDHTIECAPILATDQVSPSCMFWPDQPVIIRGAEPGDQWQRQDGKMIAVKDTLRAMGVPNEKRWRHPCVVLNDQIVWVVGAPGHLPLESGEMVCTLKLWR